MTVHPICAGDPVTLLRNSTPDLIARALRDEIVAGVLQGGQPIRQDEVALRLGVSKSPVREALRRLEAEGFVVFHPRRGAVVAEVSIEEVSEAFEIRLSLEPAVLERAVVKCSSTDLELARQRLAALDREEDPRLWGKLNWEFHEALYVPAGRAMTVGILRNLHDRIDRFLRLQMVLIDGKDRSSREHGAILEACVAKDGPRAGRLLAEHIAGVGEIILEYAEDRAGRAAAEPTPKEKNHALRQSRAPQGAQ